MTHRYLDSIMEAAEVEQVKKEMGLTHIKFLSRLAAMCGGMKALKEFIWDFERSVGKLTPGEILRAVKRENQIKAHYEGTTRKGGRPNKIQALFEEVQEYAESMPGWLSYDVMKIAKLYGSHAAPGTRLSLTSQWRLNKKLKAAGLPEIPWRSIIPAMTEEEFEMAVMRYNSAHAEELYAGFKEAEKEVEARLNEG